MLKDLTFTTLILSLLLLLPCNSAPTGGAVIQEELWCVAKNNAEDAALQAALDWACGQGGANCSPIQQGGACYNPSDILNTASYAFNDYFLKNGMTSDACSFSNTAAITTLNPSHGNCKFPSSKTKTNANISSGVGAFSPQSADFSGCNRRFHEPFLLLIIGYLVLAIRRIL